MKPVAMTRVERSILVGVVILSMIWAGGLLVDYMMQSDEAPVAATLATPPIGAAGATTMPSLPAMSSLSATIASGVPTPQEKRKNISAFWAGHGLQNAMSRPHARWEDRKGVILPPPPDLNNANAAETDSTKSDSSLSATLVSLHLDGAPLRAALLELGKQANAKFVVFPPFVWRQTAFPPITIDVDHQPLIEVVNEICCKAGLTSGWRMNRWGGGEPATADPATPVMPLEAQLVDNALGPWVVSGPFAFEVEQVDHFIPLGNPAGALPTDALPTGAVNLSLVVQHEPKIVVLAVQPVTATEAVDENGLSLLPPASRATSTSPAPATPTTITAARSLVASLFGVRPSVRRAPGPWQPAGSPMQIGLNCPVNAGKWIERVKFAPKFLVQARSETMTIAIKSPMDPVQQTLAGMQVEVAPLVVQNQQFCNDSITYTRAQQTDEQWQQMQVALQSIKPVLLDANSQAFPQPQASFQQQSDQSITIQYTWVQQQYTQEFTSLVPAKMVLTLPSVLRVVNVPVEFNHLPLP